MTNTVREELIQIPKWLWVILVGGVGWCGHASIELAETSNRLAHLEKENADTSALVTLVHNEQLKRTNPVYSVGDVKQELASLREVIEKLREDVIVLKTERERSGSN